MVPGLSFRFTYQAKISQCVLLHSSDLLFLHQLHVEVLLTLLQPCVFLDDGVPCLPGKMLKKSGAIAFYFPDWMLVQQSEHGPVNWIVDTKGCVWDGTKAKDAAINMWCEEVSEQTDSVRRFIRVNQSVFDKKHYATFSALLADEDLSQHLWSEVTGPDGKATQ